MEVMINKGNDKVVVVDPGKNSVKVLVFSADYKLLNMYLYPSKTQSKRNFAGIDSGSANNYQVEFKKSKYLVGEGVLKKYNFDITKNNLHHKLCIYTGVGKAVDKINENVHVVVGYPSSDFENITQKQDYISLLEEENPVQITINDTNKEFKISGIAVYPEGMALFPRIKNANKNIHVVDIGGQNINYRFYDKKGNTLNSFSLDCVGMNHLQEYIKTELRRVIQADKVDIESIDLDNAINKGVMREVNDDFISEYKNGEEFIKTVVNEFIESTILAGLSGRGVNLYQRGSLIVFTGGGSIALSKYIKDILKNNEGNMIFSTTAQWDNCISYAIKDMSDRYKKMNKLLEAQLISKKILSEIEQGIVSNSFM